MYPTSQVGSHLVPVVESQFAQFEEQAEITVDVPSENVRNKTIAVVCAVLTDGTCYGTRVFVRGSDCTTTN